MLKKKKSNVFLTKVPSLDFEPMPLGNNSRLMPITRKGSLDSLMLEYRKIDSSIDEVNKILIEIKNGFIPDISQDIRSIKHDVQNILTFSDRSPRVMSRVDAAVANSQMLIANFDEKSKSITNHDDMVVELLGDLTRRIGNLEEKVILILEKLESPEKTT